MLVLGVEWDGEEPVGFDRCIDVAAGQTVPRNAHHDQLHVGQAGKAQFGAGNLVVPTVLSGFANCSELAAVFG